MSENGNHVEAACLSAMANDGSALRIALVMLEETDFHDTLLASAFAAAQRLAFSGAAVDEATIPAELKENQRDRFLVALKDVANPGNIETYCRQVRAGAGRRALRDTSIAIADGLRRSEKTSVLWERASTGLAKAAVKLADDPLPPLREMDVQTQELRAGQRIVLPSPWPRLCSLTQAMIPGTVILLCGTPGVTKSFAVLQLIRYLHAAKIPCACHMLEDDGAFHLRRALAQEAKTPAITNLVWLRDHAAEYDEIRTKYATWLEGVSECITGPGDDDPTPEAELGWAHERLRAGARFIAIDPITMLDYGRDLPTGARRFMTRIKRMARLHRATIMLVTHPRQQQGAQGKPKPQTMDDLAGGTAFSRQPHTVLFLQYHDVADTEVKVEYGRIIITPTNRTMQVFKARNGQGERKRWAMMFEAETLTLRECGEEV